MNSGRAESGEDRCKTERMYDPVIGARHPQRLSLDWRGGTRTEKSLARMDRLFQPTKMIKVSFVKVLL